jgi:hypothetical protein
MRLTYSPEIHFVRTKLRRRGLEWVRDGGSRATAGMRAGSAPAAQSGSTTQRSRGPSFTP